MRNALEKGLKCNEGQNKATILYMKADAIAKKGLQLAYLYRNESEQGKQRVNLEKWSGTEN
jgi:hypothetical protein